MVCWASRLEQVGLDAPGRTVKRSAPTVSYRLRHSFDEYPIQPWIFDRTGVGASRAALRRLVSITDGCRRIITDRRRQTEAAISRL